MLNRIVRTSGRTLILTALAAELLVSLQSHLKVGFFGPPKAEDDVGPEHSEVGVVNLDSDHSSTPQGDFALQTGDTAHPVPLFHAPHSDLLI